MKNTKFFIITILLLSACSSASPKDDSAEIKNTPQDNLCYSEYSLTDAECGNISSYLYEVSGFMQGPGVPNASDATGFFVTVNIRVTFSEQDGSTTISNPSQRGGLLFGNPSWYSYNNSFEVNNEPVHAYVFSS